MIAMETNRYGNQDWVRPANTSDHPDDIEENFVDMSEDEGEDESVVEQEGEDESVVEEDDAFDSDEGPQDGGNNEDYYDNDPEDDDPEDDQEDQWGTPSTAAARTRQQAKKRRGFVSCPANHKQARHRFHARENIPWRNVTPGYLLVYFGILILHDIEIIHPDPAYDPFC
jgi:hypothetical protein